MSKRETFQRYSLIVGKIKSQPVSLQEIKDFLQLQSEYHGYNFNISTRTFQRDIEDIRSLFDVEIAYNHTTKKYHIIDDAINNANERILDAFNIFQALKYSENIREYVHFDNRQPGGTQFLANILHALKNRKKIKMVHAKFSDDEPKERLIAPLALKEFEHRWYVVALNTDDNSIKLYGLDRIMDISVTPLKFVYPVDFKLEQYFKNTFGVFMPNDDEVVQKVVLKFSAYQGKYIKTLPLHHSQTILLENDEELRVELELYLTQDFKMELLKYGSSVEIISPLELKKEILKIHRLASLGLD